ncbi:LRP4 [Symbiodinium sp. KB8]|nr:LRP4 [Symbiodinium sp. KB8]
MLYANGFAPSCPAQLLIGLFTLGAAQEALHPEPSDLAASLRSTLLQDTFQELSNAGAKHKDSVPENIVQAVPHESIELNTALKDIKQVGQHLPSTAFGEGPGRPVASAVTARASTGSSLPPSTAPTSFASFWMGEAERGYGMSSHFSKLAVPKQATSASASATSAFLQKNEPRDFTRAPTADLEEVSISEPFRALEQEDLREVQRLKGLDRRLRQRAAQRAPAKPPQHAFQGSDASTWAALEEEEAIQLCIAKVTAARRARKARNSFAQLATGCHACRWLWALGFALALGPTPASAVLDVLTGLSMPRGLALDLRERRMYWTEGGTQKLRSATLDGQELDNHTCPVRFFSTPARQDLRDVVVKSEVQEAPRDVAVDAEQRKVYWTALCCGLRRADLNGENEEVVASAEFASGVTVNKDVLYWADWMNGRILRRSPSGLEEPIVTGLASPVDVALDAGSGMIYWSDVGHARTQRALLDGRGIQALNMSWAIMNTYGMAIDASDRKLYMTDFEKTGDFTGSASDYAGRIIRTNLDGSDAEVLVSEPGMSMPYGVAVDPEYAQVYWTDRKAGRIQRLTLKCPAGVLEVASRMNSSNIKVAHGTADHGSSIQVPCPEGYNGSMTLACNNNKFSLNAGKCGKHCAAGSAALELDGSTFALDHPSLDDREVLMSTCPGHLVGTAEFICQDGKTLLSNAGCRRAHSCPAGQFLLGHALVQHSAMDHGIMEPSSCPEGFEVQKHGEFSCRATCDTAGSLWVDDGAVEERPLLQQATHRKDHMQYPATLHKAPPDEPATRKVLSNGYSVSWLSGSLRNRLS